MFYWIYSSIKFCSSTVSSLIVYYILVHTLISTSSWVGWGSCLQNHGPHSLPHTPHHPREDHQSSNVVQIFPYYPFHSSSSHQQNYSLKGWVKVRTASITFTHLVGNIGSLLLYRRFVCILLPVYWMWLKSILELGLVCDTVSFPQWHCRPVQEGTATDCSSCPY